MVKRMIKKSFIIGVVILLVVSIVCPVMGKGGLISSGITIMLVFSMAGTAIMTGALRVDGLLELVMHGLL